MQASLSKEQDAKSWFGCYIAPHDVAQACRLAVTSAATLFEQDIPFEAFYLTAKTTFLPQPTLVALRQYFDPLPQIRDSSYFQSDPYAPPFDTRKARRLLGFRAAKDWRGYDSW
jgi:hypothetical protein